jgi:hypothetical protein
MAPARGALILGLRFLVGPSSLPAVYPYLIF